MLFSVRLPLVIALSLFLLSLLGCGEKTVVGTNVSKVEASQNCIDCHEARVSLVTGKSVAEEWQLSAHNLNNKAGCADCHFESLTHSSWHPDCTKCHGGTPLAGTKGLPPYAIRNPDSYGSCAKCHTAAGGFRMSVYDGITTNPLTAHFSTPSILSVYTTSKTPARYVTKNYEKSCRSCHNPHDTTSQINILRQWARSGKGDVNALPWKYYDFKTRGTSTPGATPANSFGTDCVRCHTATGHKNYLNTGGIAPFGTSKTDGKEVLACNVCHVDYSYARRQVGAVTAYYNKSTVSKMRIRIPVTYPNIGESNLCLNCHVGRETGRIIKELADPTKTASKLITPSGAYNFSNASFENSHYLTAGATVFKTSGFEFYSSHYYNNPSFYAHDKIGVSNFNNTGTSGPCITCHMKPGNHTFLPVAKDSNGNITSLTSTTCNNALCHNGSMSAAEIEHQKVQYNAAMDALITLFQGKMAVYFRNSSPYFFTSPTGSTAAKNWVSGGDNSTGPNNMGAAFNYNLLYHDFGAFAHNRFYAKRLIYDSISWLYDNNLRTTTSFPLGYFSDVEASIQNSLSLTAQQKSDACNYLFTSRSYPTYIPGDSRNWRPGSDPLSPVY